MELENLFNEAKKMKMQIALTPYDHLESQTSTAAAPAASSSSNRCNDDQPNKREMDIVGTSSSRLELPPQDRHLFIHNLIKNIQTDNLHLLNCIRQRILRHAFHYFLFYTFIFFYFPTRALAN